MKFYLQQLEIQRSKQPNRSNSKSLESRLATLRPAILFLFQDIFVPNNSKRI